MFRAWTWNKLFQFCCRWRSGSRTGGPSGRNRTPGWTWTVAACRPPGPRPAAATRSLAPVRPRPPMPSSTTTTPPSPSWPRRPEWPATRPPPWPPSSSTHRHRRTGWVRRLTACGPTCSSPALFLEDILHQEIILHCYATTSSATTTQLYVLVYTVLSKLSLPDLFAKLYYNYYHGLLSVIIIQSSFEYFNAYIIIIKVIIH